MSRGPARLFTAVLLAAAFGAAGCGLLGGGEKTGGVEVVPAGKENLELRIVGGSKLNVCEGDVANVLVLRVYQLSSDSAFLLSTQTRLWEDDEGELGDTMLERREEILEPGQVLELEIESKANATHLAVAGNFCRAEGDCWRWVGEWKDLGDLRLEAGASCLTPKKK